MRLRVFSRSSSHKKQHTFEAFSTTAIYWTPLVLRGTAMPPRDPDEDEEDEDDEEEDDADEPPVVREPDDD
ncbi:hypothetical protein IVB25_29475 [Bradyrhizobium sp. 193]|nr:hypothetical protein [Bradyrhizobium sp. 84]MCK1374814.1 hypothetical protein [Bradyrhizobium sp. 49]MCK1486709.1 hypothetical protein [Bradyrhizobium sp. 193]MCK1496914.1 hypothetical protein [Bradyrhizobium sp. 188]